MIEQHQIWFDQLAKDREDSAKTLEKPSMRGIKNSVVEKYSDQAHFIYELLQNANDAKATKSSFQLTTEGLYFKHNGKIHFSVSNPDTEDQDKENNTLGHINSITAIANSNKTESFIGKFGVGFKAVFQYTETPHIFDPNFQFKIDRFIVPVKLENDLANRQNDETVFYFPFNKTEMSAEEAHSDILEKLKKLVFPTLFLSNLQEVKWNADSESGEYTKKGNKQKQADDITYEKIELYQQIGLQQTQEKLYLFSRSTEENHSYSIGFFLDEKNKLSPKQFSAFCFFPTKETTNLNFILHAPFLLTDSREGIHRSKEHNTEMVELLAQLAADSLLILKDLKLINEDIVEIIPYKKTTEDDLFKPFHETIKEEFQTEEILPAKDGSYAKKENAYWASVPKIAELFSNKQLSELLEDENDNKWVFALKGRDETIRGNKELADYIDLITNIWLDEKDLLTGWSYENGIKQKGITSNFIEKQNDEWLFLFYKWIAETDGRKNLIKDKPFFLNQEREAISIFDENDKLVLFLPDNSNEDYDTLNAGLFKTSDIILSEENKVKGKKKQLTNDEEIQHAKQFYEKFGIREYTVADEIEGAIEKFKNEQISAELFFNKAFKYFKNECPQDEIDNFITKIKNFKFIPYFKQDDDNGFSYAWSLYYPTEKLVEFYRQKRDTKFVNIKELQSKYSKKDFKTLDKFLIKLGVKNKDPELKDEIYNIILPKYNSSDFYEIDEYCKDFKTILKYYQECPNNETEKFIDNLKSLRLLLYTTTNEPEKLDFSEPQNLYYPSDNLQKYFETKSDTKFVNLENYYTFTTEEKEQQILKDFLLKLGVKQLPSILGIELDFWETRNLRDQFGRKLENGTRKNKTIDKNIDGCVEIINEITKKYNTEKSILLWEFLNKLSQNFYKNQLDNLKSKLTGKHDFFFRFPISRSFESKIQTILKNERWLLSNTGEFVAPHEITINELADEYEKESYQANQLIELLQFKPLVELTEAERKLQTLNEFENDGYDENRIRKLIEEDKAKQNATTSSNGNNRNSNNTDNNLDDNNSGQQKSTRIKELSDLKSPEEQTEDRKGRIREDIQLKAGKELSDEELQEEVEKRVREEREKLNRKIELVNSINNNTKYSYDWFKAYLQLLTTYGEKQDTQKQKSISFQEIKPYKADNKYFLLCGASSYISPEIENADDFKVSLVFGNGNRENITVEGVSKKGQDLLIYCREALSGNTLSRFANIFKVEINFTPVIDLLDRLYKAFTNDNYIDEWQTIQEAIPFLNFIYGPPGTGKTTTLCNNINDILAENPNAKFLVLTPTNKAADVVCKKLQDINPNIYAVRLSRPTDPELEESGIYVDTLDNKSLHNINVVTSTIHRLSYFEINGEKDGENFEYKLFKHRNFDYVIFDEASMTGLHYITFAVMALFKTNPNTNFVVAGDPKQIPPVIEIDEKELENFDFQDENIYKMMSLESFNPEEQTIREDDTIQNLDTQYRSIPQIGQLFSELSYSSLLKHERETNRKETKQLSEKFRKLISSNVTFVDIPLNQDISIYKINKLFYSSYHTYCAILVSEIVKYFDATNENEQWTIGLIAPYKAQAILLNKLITSYGISENVKVFSDTVHGFQGDECDIVFFVCNPNNYFYSGHEKALLSKEYIYNVAISRAKDYLIILHPYTEIQNNNFINKIGLSYKKNFGNTKIINAKDIEKALFNDENYIENNSYVSGHDNVNVFGLSEMKYFIKANDTAIDIQLRD